MSVTERTQTIPIAKPWLGEAEAEAARRAILSGWVTQGPEVAAFEREFAALTGAPYACAVSNCTTALHLALLAVGVGAGDEVITVSHSFIATANVIRYCGGIPVFVDIEPETYNMDPALVEQAITPRTRAILCVHQMGMPCDLQTLAAIARRHNLPLIEDAACAAGSELRWDGAWQRIGRPVGDIACFSFHPRKVITTGDGGMLTTANAALDRQFRLLRQHAMSVPDTTRHGAKDVLFEAYEAVGYNYRMTDIQAAVGREQLKRLPEIIAKRRWLAALYHEVLSSIDGVTAPREPEWARSNWQSYCVRLPDRCDQRVVMQRLLDGGIATRRGIMCSHLEPAYQDGSWRCIAGQHQAGCTCLQQSERAQRQGLLLPLFYQMSESDVHTVGDALRKAVAA
jgi:dTDP-4-amino-4,6-dideoxygalactose transaminase